MNPAMIAEVQKVAKAEGFAVPAPSVWRDAMEMGAFTSQTLNRTFEKILFVSQIVVVR